MAKIRIKPPCLNIDELEEESAFYDESEPNVIYVEAKTKNNKRLPCPVCGSINTVRNGWGRDRYIHDISQGLNKIDIILHVDRWKCLERECGTSFSHRYDFVDSNKTMTKRLIETIQVEAFTRPFSNIAKEYGITTPTVLRLFISYCKELEANREPPVAPRVLGIDENHIADELRGVLIDIETGNLIDITSNRKIPTIKRAIRRLKDYEEIEVVTMDMYTGYRTAIHDVIPKAKVVVDKFHVVQNIQRAVASARKIISARLRDQIKQIEDPVERKEKDDLITRMGKHTYLFKYSEHSLEEHHSNASLMAELCLAFPELNELRNIKEKAEKIYDAYDSKEAAKYLDEWMASVPSDDSAYESMRSAVKSSTNFRKEILAYFDTGYFTNAATEGVNHLIKHINEIGWGYSFETLRYKVLLCPTARANVVVSRKRPVMPEIIDEEDVVNMLEDDLITPQKAIGLIKKNKLNMDRYREIRAKRDQALRPSFGFTTHIGSNINPHKKLRTKPKISAYKTEGYQIDAARLDEILDDIL